MCSQNKNIEIVDFEPAHLHGFVPRPEDALDLAGLTRPELEENCQGWRTVLRGGVAAFFYGVEYHGLTVSLCAITSPLVDSMPLLITRLARGVIEGALLAGARRVDTYCHADNRRSLHWLTRSLGMRVEGLLRQCGPDAQDRFVLSIIREDWASLPWATGCRPRAVSDATPRRMCGLALSRAEGDGCEPETTLSGEATSPIASGPTGSRPRAASEKESLPWAR